MWYKRSKLGYVSIGNSCMNRAILKKDHDNLTNNPKGQSQK